MNCMPPSAEKMNAYCFNPACSCSVFNLRTMKVIEITLDEATLSNQLSCQACGQELVSLLSIEIQKACLGNTLIY
jgi:hypothetical protein